MTHSSPEPDDELLVRLRSIAARVDGPPAHVDELARGALATRHLDRLAEVLFDSAVDGELVRGPDDGPRMLTIAAGPVRLEVEVVGEGVTVAVKGYATGVSGPLEVESASGSVSASPDEDGWFSVGGLRPGLLRLAVTGADGSRVRTPWFDA